MGGRPGELRLDDLDFAVRSYDPTLAYNQSKLAVVLYARHLAATRERPLSIALPNVATADDCAAAQAKVLSAVAAGDLLPGEGEAIAGLIEHQRRSLETSDLIGRMHELERILKENGKL